MTVNERIKEVRRILGMTQKQFAERIAVSVSYLSDMERGDTNVNDRVVRLVSMEFGVSEHWIRTGEGSMYNNEQNVNAAKLLSVFNSLAPEYQQGALAMLDVLADIQNSGKTK